MKIPFLIVAGVVVSLTAAAGYCQEKANPASADQIAASQKKIKDLQKERIATLKEVVEQLTARSRAGRAEFDEVFEARLEVHGAELAATEKSSERIETQKKIIEVLGEYEKVAESRRAMARGPSSMILKVKARRLQAEIDLEQAKIKEAGETKSGG